ncbi:MAG: molybdopterin biosynthesis protein [Sporomusaceae bacterium]|nr:molybdopterin biosynthesis protein [Sporomusaceae bacterium]
MKNKAYLECIPRETAVKLWQEKLKEYGYFTDVPAEIVAVTDALGRVTARSIYAQQSVPHYNGAAMDGIAVNAKDTFGASEANPVNLLLLKKGQEFVPNGCYLIDTGDMMPDNTNAVIMIEDVHLSANNAAIIAAGAPWQHVRIIGEDIVAGEMVLPEGSLIAPADIAALIAAGLEEIQVIKKVKAAVIPTGTEIVATVKDLKPGAILDVNSHMICAALREWGADPLRKEIAIDDESVIKAKVKAALQEADLVMTIAGTSAGGEDYTAKVLGELGEVLVHGVAIKPGKPVILAVCEGKPVIGLPGYPVSAMLAAELFVKDIVLARGKLEPEEPHQTKAFLTKQLHSQVGMEEYIRISLGTIRGKQMAVPLKRGAGVISSLIKAHAHLKVPKTSAGINAQEEVTVDLFSGRKTGQSLLAIGSHDLALDILGVFLKRETGLSLVCANVGSMGGIMAVKNDETHLAGIHMLDENSGQYNLSFVRKYLGDKDCQLIHLTKREQGLMVLPDNPKKIQGLADLSQPGLVYVNRQRGSGTRMLLDYLLRQNKIHPQSIEGYEKEVSTHMAVGASIVARSVDTGLGIKAAADALSLQFIPIATEDYDLLLNLPASDPLLKTITAILKSPQFRQEVERLGGYDLTMSGNVLAP